MAAVVPGGQPARLWAPALPVLDQLQDTSRRGHFLKRTPPEADTS